MTDKAKLENLIWYINQTLAYVRAMNTLYSDSKGSINIGECIKEIEYQIENALEKVEDDDIDGVD